MTSFYNIMTNRKSLEYSYIVVGYGYDYYKYVYRQLDYFTNTFFVEDWPSSKMIRRVYNRLPLKRFWLAAYIRFLRRVAEKMHLNKENKICFVLLAGGVNNVFLRHGLCAKIRDTFVNSKVVFFINDLVSRTNQPVLLMKEQADLVYSFDPNDCERYGLIYHVIPYSDFNFHVVNQPEYDVVFVGAAKDRLKDLLKIHSYLSGKGVKCGFIIIEVKDEDQVQAEGITYSERITYEENLRLLQNGNCILDVIQGGSKGNTIRVGEAIIMGKKLLSNNTNIPNNGVYDEQYMRCFDKAEDIDVAFVLDRTPVSYEIKEHMYPTDLFANIEKTLANE